MPYCFSLKILLNTTGCLVVVVFPFVDSPIDSPPTGGRKIRLILSVVIGKELLLYSHAVYGFLAFTFSMLSAHDSLCGHTSPLESVTFDSTEVLVLVGASTGVTKLRFVLILQKGSPFTVASCMFIFSARADNLPELISLIKPSLTDETVDPYLKLVEDMQLHAVSCTEEKGYGTDEVAALTSLQQ
ncbi:hypothetical protein U1Q18_008898 [Sarracenia purpurea var. burkii]